MSFDRTPRIVLAIFLSASAAFAHDERANFDIPAQPMAEALYTFSATTGIEILMDARSAAGRRSTGVSGVMTSRDALEVMLAGSGLVAENFGEGTIAVEAIAQSPGGGFSGLSGRADLPYFADVQHAVQRTLCADARTLPGRYRVALKLWIGQSGTILLSKRLDTTGDPTRDAAIDAVMQARVWVGQPPAGLPQPVTLLISPREPQEADACSSRPPDLRRASDR